MMEHRPPLTSPDGSSNGNRPERCPHPLYSRFSTQEDQVEGLIVVKIEDEEPYVKVNELHMEEETPPEISTDPRETQRDVKAEEEDEGCVRIKVEEVPVEISTDPGKTRGIQRNIKVEKKDGHVKIKEEENPMEITAGVYSNGNTQERCHGPLYSWDSQQEHHRIPKDNQRGSLVKVEVKEELEETFVSCKELPEIGADGRYRSYEAQPIICPEGDLEDDDVTDNSSDEMPITSNPQSPLPSADSSSPKRFPCTECKKSFIRKENLLTHQRIHRGEDPLSCSECGKSFIWKRQLVIHQRSHTGEKSLSCLECGKSFSERSNLVRHQKSHSAERPFACSQCSKCFTDRTKLNNHQRTHTGEKPYSCSECGERFSRKSSLTRHEKFHRGEKPYSCTECGKCFTERANLVTHYRTHTGDRPYSCSKCGRAFKQRSDLVRHEKVHLRYQWLFCSECGQQFALKDSLIAHLRTHIAQEVSASGNS
ncbi:uncharacterized protein LOC143957058 [Lithobates pipiens]